MSDDEYYGEFDEFEDAEWDADPAPDLADDLAEHASYSPVWQDDPTGELEPYHSDWEYYSDDYYDDDPVLKQHTMDGSPHRLHTSIQSKTQKRGKKRKLDEIREEVAKEDKLLLQKTIGGTVWAHNNSRPSNIVRWGEEEKVSLLKDWKSLFSTDDGERHTFGRGQLHRDESWANDLSLSDMGLLSGRDATTAGLDQALDPDIGDQSSPDANIDDMSEEDDVEDHDQETMDSNGILMANAAYRRDDDVLDSREEPDAEETFSKRRKRSKLPSPPRSSGSSQIVVRSSIQDSPELNVRSEKGLRQDVGTSHKDNTAKCSPADLDPTFSIHKPQLRSSKRKLSPEQEQLDNIKAEAESRNKRVASSKLRHIGKATEEPHQSPGISKSMRNRNK